MFDKISQVKHFAFLLFTILLSFHFSWSQNLHLQINGTNDTETKIIDSLNYLKKHVNYKSIQDTQKSIVLQLNKKGFLASNITSTKPINDTLILSTYDLGSKINKLGIFINPEDATLLNLPDSVYWTKFENVENFIQENLLKLEAKGYSLTKIELENFYPSNKDLLAHLKVHKTKKRLLNEIVINGYKNFPKSHQKIIDKKFLNKTFNKENLEQLRKEYENFRFINQTKSPEILFTTDSTKTYVYIEKSNNNTFDGYIGFTNNNEESSKIQFNGYLDISLTNLLNTGELFKIYWKNDGKQQSTFDATLELPYVFNSKIGVRGNLNIFKQDSTFQNTRTGIEAGYYFNYNSKLHIGYQSTESSDISNSNSLNLNDYKNSFYTATYNYLQPSTNDDLFFEKLKLNLKIGTGNRSSKLNNSKQQIIELIFNYQIYLNQKNRILLKSTNYFLNSPHYMISELYRFGGLNSIRGFQENELQGNLFTSLNTEYIHLLNPNIYVNTIFDYGYSEDPIANFSDKYLGIGIGAGIKTKTGLMKINYVNGNKNNKKREFKNSIIHISFIVKF